MLDWRGQLAEGTGANIFLVINGELHTPTPDCFLNGITRQTVIGLAKARGIKVVERAIMPEELAKADEVFLTGSAAEVTPVGEIDRRDRPLPLHPGHDLPADVGRLRPHRRQAGRQRRLASFNSEYAIVSDERTDLILNMLRAIRAEQAAQREKLDEIIAGSAARRGARPAGRVILLHVSDPLASLGFAVAVRHHLDPARDFPTIEPALRDRSGRRRDARMRSRAVSSKPLFCIRKDMVLS